MYYVTLIKKHQKRLKKKRLITVLKIVRFLDYRFSLSNAKQKKEKRNKQNISSYLKNKIKFTQSMTITE